MEKFCLLINPVDSDKVDNILKKFNLKKESQIKYFIKYNEDESIYNIENEIKEILIQNNIQFQIIKLQDFEDEFKEYVKRENIEIYDNLSDILPLKYNKKLLSLKKGDFIKVSHTGQWWYITSGPYEILGFQDPDIVYLNLDCYWWYKVNIYDILL